MKKLLTLFVCLLATVCSKADPVGLEVAKNVAQKVLGKQVRLLGNSNSHRATKQIEANPTYYMFNAEDGSGFALITGDDMLPQVLGYSSTGKLLEKGDLPEALATYLDIYDQYVNAVRNGQLSDTEDLTNAFALRRGAGAPFLCESEWGQGDPYNRQCPVLKDIRCPVGCVATALAQTMFYWKWPIKGQGYGQGKDTDGETHHGTLEHTYNWDIMKNTRVENLASDEACAAVSQLSYDCGLAVGMTWGTNGSGAGTPVCIKALYTNFGYIPTTLRPRMRECYESEKDYLTVIAEEIDAGRPVIQSASSKTGTDGDAAGHAYVIDGYDANGFVHVNWGWNGDANGYFDLAKMNPMGYTFTLSQTTITGIVPAKNGETGTPTEYPYLAYSPKSDRKLGDKIRWKSVSFKATVGGVYNYNGNAHTWTMALGVYDNNNRLIGQISDPRNTITISLEPSHYYKEDAFSNIECKLNKELENGEYAVRVMFKENNGEWILPDMAGGMKKNAIYFKLEGNYITFTDGTEYNATTSISSLKRDESFDSSLRYYDLQGRELNGPSKGLVIRKQGNTVRKVIIK